MTFFKKLINIINKLFAYIAILEQYDYESKLLDFICKVKNNLSIFK